MVSAQLKLQSQSEIISQTSTILEVPRSYQTYLFNRAKDANVLAILDTGAGKVHFIWL